MKIIATSNVVKTIVREVCRLNLDWDVDNTSISQTVLETLDQ